MKMKLQLLMMIAITIVCLFSLGLTAQADITSDLVGHWPFDDGAGTDVADVVGGKTGKYYEKRDAGGTPDWRAGIVGSGSMFFDGAGQWINVPGSVGDGVTPTDVQLTETDYTISAWINYVGGTAGGGRAIYQDPGNTVEGYGIRVLDGAGEDGQILWSHHEGNGEGGNDHISEPGSALPKDGNWHHVAFVHQSPGERTYYLDGAPFVGPNRGHLGSRAAGSSASYGLAFAGLNLFGNPDNVDPIQFFSGGLDDIRLYSRALSSRDIGGLIALQVPEPSSCVLMGLGLACLAAAVRRRRSA